MSVVAEALSVVIQNATLERSFPDGLDGYRRHCPNATLCSDGRLTRVGFMSPHDVNAFCRSLRDLFGFALVDEQGAFVDIAVVDQMTGPTATCSWLEFEVTAEGVSHCWLSGTPQGELAVPEGWTAEGSRTMRWVPKEDVPNMLMENRAPGLDQTLFADTGKVMFVGRPFEDLRRAEQLFREAREAEAADDDFEALRKYEEARSLAPQNANLAYCAGVVRQRLDGDGAAIADYREALRLNPSHQNAACNLGGCLADLGHLSESREWLKLATDLDPEDPIAWWMRGATEYRLGLDDAIATYKRFLNAIAKRPIGADDDQMIAWARQRIDA